MEKQIISAVISARISLLIQQDRFKEADTLFYRLLQLASNRLVINEANEADEAVCTL